jgi:hypothetical protein
LPLERLAIDEILSRLEAGPARIASLTQGLTEAQLHTAPSEGEWSANDVLAHLRACSDVWGNIVAALCRDGQVPRNVAHPRQHVKRIGYLDLEFAPSFAAFSAARTELTAGLMSLPPEAWELPGPPRGWTLVCGRSLIDQASGVVQHEGAHIEQIEEVVRALH